MATTIAEFVESTSSGSALVEELVDVFEIICRENDAEVHLVSADAASSWEAARRNYHEKLTRLLRLPADEAAPEATAIRKQFLAAIQGREQLLDMKQQFKSLDERLKNLRP